MPPDTQQLRPREYELPGTESDMLALQSELRRAQQIYDIEQSEAARDARDLAQLRLAAVMRGEPIPTVLPGEMTEAARHKQFQDIARILADWKIAQANLESSDEATVRTAMTNLTNSRKDLHRTIQTTLEAEGAFQTEAQKTRADTLSQYRDTTAAIAEDRGWESWRRKKAGIDVAIAASEFAADHLGAIKELDGQISVKTSEGWFELQSELNDLAYKDRMGNTPSAAVYLAILKEDYKFDLPHILTLNTEILGSTEPSWSVIMADSVRKQLWQSTLQAKRAQEDAQLLDQRRDTAQETWSTYMKNIGSPVFAKSPELQKMLDWAMPQYDISEGAEERGLQGKLMQVAEDASKQPTAQAAGIDTPEAYKMAEAYLRKLATSDETEFTKKRAELMATPLYQQFVAQQYPEVNNPEVAFQYMMDDAIRNFEAAKKEGLQTIEFGRERGISESPNRPLGERLQAAARAFKGEAVEARGTGTGSSAMMADSEGEAATEAQEPTVSEANAAQQTMRLFLSMPEGAWTEEERATRLENLKVPDAVKAMSPEQQRQFAGMPALNEEQGWSGEIVPAEEGKTPTKAEIPEFSWDEEEEEEEEKE